MEYKQKTIKKEVFLKGVGLFTGEKVSIKLKPLKENSGIVFQRVDLPGSPQIKADVNSVKETPRCTILGCEKANVLTIEHLMSAIYAFGIDNLLIEVDGPEIPVCDGSAKVFVKLAEEAGVVLQKKNKKLIVVKDPIYWSSKHIHLIALPSSEYKISYLLHYPKSKVLRYQYFTSNIDLTSYKKEISSARTFSIYKEIEPMLQKGLIKGGGLNNAVVITDDKILNPDGIRYSDEMARHKILDLIGDLSLLGGKIFAHIIAIRSGHFANISFAKKILKNGG